MRVCVCVCLCVYSCPHTLHKGQRRICNSVFSLSIRWILRISCRTSGPQQALRPGRPSHQPLKQCLQHGPPVFLWFSHSLVQSSRSYAIWHALLFSKYKFHSTQAQHPETGLYSHYFPAHKGFSAFLSHQPTYPPMKSWDHLNADLPQVTSALICD